MAELGQIAAYLGPFWRRLLLALLLSLLTVGSGIGLMMVSAWLISMAALQLGIVSLGVAPTAVRFFGLSRALFRYLERLVSHDLTLRLLTRLRVRFYERLEPLSLTQIQAFRRGDLIARVVSDIEELQNFYLRVAAPPLTAILITALTGLAFSRIDGRTAVVLVAAMLFSSISLPLTAWIFSRRYGSQLVQQRQALRTLLLDLVQGIGDSLVWNYTKTIREAMVRQNQETAQIERQQGRIDGLQMGLTLLLTQLAATAVLWTAAGRVDGLLLGTLTLGSIAAFEAIIPLSEAGLNLSREQAAAARVLHMIKSAPAIPSPATGPTPSSAPYLRIENLTFRYAADEPTVLANLSLTIPFGEKILIAGESGAGKSSLVNILLRLTEFEQGRVTLDSHDFRQMSIETIRRTFAVMTQNSYLFNTTIGENIRIGRKSATDAEIAAAAKQAQVDAFINTLPNRYETYVGEMGGRLSGGERQRIALARMLLRDAPIWILDEPTANLDPVTAVAVLKTIFSLGAGKTILLISHRPEINQLLTFDQEFSLHFP
jgi:ATP-binding cassette subfamily C protein CydC